MFKTISVMALIAGMCAMPAFAQGGGGGPDTVNITGIVTNSSGGTVSGATVVARAGGMGGMADSVTGTTDGSGAFSLTLISDRNIYVVTVTASTTDAEGTGFGQPDENGDVVIDIALGGGIIIPSDTVTVSGTVVDSATGDPLQGASIVLSYREGGMNGQMVTVTATTDENGNISEKITTTMAFGNISWTASMSGYASDQGSASIQNGEASLDTIMLAPISIGETLEYSVTGTITDSLGIPLRNVEVSVTVNYAGTVVVDTMVTTGRRGTYTVRTSQEYVAGDIIATVSAARVDSQGTVLDEVSQVETVPTSTTIITVNLTFGDATASAPVSLIKAPVKLHTGQDGAFTVSGRYIGRQNANRVQALRLHGSTARIANQTLIIKRAGINGTQQKQIIMPQR